jgi:hypothetical protein
MAMSNKGMGKGRVVGHPTVGQASPNALDEEDIANEIEGRNKLQGDDQSHVRNQRLAYPDTPTPGHRKETGRGPR